MKFTPPLVVLSFGEYEFFLVKALKLGVIGDELRILNTGPNMFEYNLMFRDRIRK